MRMYSYRYRKDNCVYSKSVAYACKCKTISAENEVLVQIDSYFLLT